MNVTNEIQEALKAFPFWKERESAEKTALELERAELIRRADELEKKQGVEWTTNSTAFNMSALKVEKIRKQLEDAERELQRANYQRASVNAGFDGQRNRIRIRLQVSVFPCLADAAREFQEEYEKLRQSKTETLEIHEPTGGIDRNSGAPLQQTFSQFPSLKRRMVALNEGAKACRNVFPLTLASEAEAISAIEKLKAELPSLTMEKVGEPFTDVRRR